MQNGDNDLRDTDVNEGRSIASLMKNDFKVSLGSRTLDLGQFMSGSKATNTSDSSEVLAQVALEVGDAESETEVGQRQTEFRSLISGLIGEHTRDELRSKDGMIQLKREIVREINNVMSKGKVRDVYFSEYLVR